MFEVEQKFNLTEEQKIRLLDGAQFLDEKRVNDAYYDTDSFTITKKDWWLRSRDGGYELKAAAAKNAGQLVRAYDEIEDERFIREKLGLPLEGVMPDVLLANGFRSFCVCHTIRQTYTKGDFTIVLDEVSYDGSDWQYRLCEIELLVATKEEMPAASQRIAAFAKTSELNSEYLAGKVVAFMKRERPEHYHALIDAGVVRAN